MDIDVPVEYVNSEAGLSKLTNQEINCIDRIDGGNISYEEFFSRYLSVNKPCILSQEMTANWKSRLEWVDGNGKPNFEFLKEYFGNFFNLKTTFTIKTICAI